MSYLLSTLNPDASKLVGYVAAHVSGLAISSQHGDAVRYEIRIKHSFSDGFPWVDFQAILSEDPEHHPILTPKETQSREERIFVSKRRIFQVGMKSYDGTHFIVRFGEVAEDGVVFSYSERKAIASQKPKDQRIMADMGAAASRYLTTGNIITLVN